MKIKKQKDNEIDNINFKQTLNSIIEGGTSLEDSRESGSDKNY